MVPFFRTGFFRLEGVVNRMLSTESHQHAKLAGLGVDGNPHVKLDIFAAGLAFATVIEIGSES